MLVRLKNGIDEANTGGTDRWWWWRLLLVGETWGVSFWLDWYFLRPAQFLAEPVHPNKWHRLPPSTPFATVWIILQTPFFDCIACYRHWEIFETKTFSIQDHIAYCMKQFLTVTIFYRFNKLCYVLTWLLSSAQSFKVFQKYHSRFLHHTRQSPYNIISTRNCRRNVFTTCKLL